MIALAVMLCVDKDAVICDLAETYHILDYKALPVPLLAVLCSGLRDDSRIKMKMANATYIPPSIVLPQIADTLTVFRYAFSKDAGEPKLMTEIMAGHTTPKTEHGYASPAEYNAARERILKGIQHG